MARFCHHAWAPSGPSGKQVLLTPMHATSPWLRRNRQHSPLRRMALTRRRMLQPDSSHLPAFQLLAYSTLRGLTTNFLRVYPHTQLLACTRRTRRRRTAIPALACSAQPLCAVWVQQTGGSVGRLTGCSAWKHTQNLATCAPCPANSEAPAGSNELSDCLCSSGFTGPDGGPCHACEVFKYKFPVTHGKV